MTRNLISKKIQRPNCYSLYVFLIIGSSSTAANSSHVNPCHTSKNKHFQALRTPWFLFLSGPRSRSWKKTSGFLGPPKKWPKTNGLHWGENFTRKCVELSHLTHNDRLGAHLVRSKISPQNLTSSAYTLMASSVTCCFGWGCEVVTNPILYVQWHGNIYLHELPKIYGKCR